MTTNRTHPRPLRFAAASAIAALALTGCAGGAKLSSADASAPGAVSKANKDSERAVARSGRMPRCAPNSASPTWPTAASIRLPPHSTMP
jgi:hypothetical protein